MSSKENISDLIAGYREDSEIFFGYVLDMMSRIQEQAGSVENAAFHQFLEKERARLNVRIKKLEKFSIASFSELQKEVDKLIKEINTFSSNNYFLEYKRNDLMILAQDLEDANEEISEKNKELERQKLQIERQTKELEKFNAQILIKNKELQQQNEYIQDQADYLHEANVAISRMHEEVQKQKEEILQKNKELVSLNNEKNNLIGIVAHDLKSPLNQIKGLITIIKLKADKVDAETMSFVDIIENSAVRLSGMINKILDVEAIEAKKPNINPEPVDVGRLMLDISKSFEVTAGEKHIGIHTEAETDQYIAELDRAYATQIFENLISNAIKFSPKRSDVYVRVNTKSGKIVCEVKDEGPGISDADKRKLFLKYQKLTAKPTGDEGSTGLGLSIVKKYVEAMEGKIWCESEEGKGASFFVSFARK